MSVLFNSSPIQWLNYHQQDFFDGDDIHVFKIHCNLYPIIEKDLARVLTEAEIEKKNRFFKIADAERFALGKYFLRKILAEQLNAYPKNIRFSISESSKPYLPEIHFNISHSGDYVVIAISKKNVGIDVELIKDHFDHELLAEVCFTSNERKLITNLEDFYTFWTRKEAILKASGEGLIDDLHDIECIGQNVQRQENNYLLKSYLMDDKHLLSLAYDDSAKDLQFWNLGVD